jgi:hypothetical protein
MTLEQLNKIMEEHNIPSDAKLMSDSECEYAATNMDGIYYNKAENILVFVQACSVGWTDYDESDDWELIYGTKDKWDEDDEDDDWVEDEVWNRQPIREEFKETQTKCGGCQYLEKCKEERRLLNCTCSWDMFSHYILGMGQSCPLENSKEETEIDEKKA